MSNSSAGTSSSTLHPESRSRRRNAAWRRSGLILGLPGLLGIAVADGPATAQPEVPAASYVVIMAADPAAEYVGAVSTVLRAASSGRHSSTSRRSRQSRR